MKVSLTNRPGQRAWKTGAAWLGLIPTLLILCLAAGPKSESSAGNDEHGAPKLEGSWLVTVTLDIPGVPPIESLVSYTAGGVVIISDTGVYPTYPMTTAYHGAWARKTGRDFVFSFVAFQYDDVDDGYPDGLWKFINKEKLTIEENGDEYNGKGTIVVYAPDRTEAGSYALTTHAVRIQPE